MIDCPKCACNDVTKRGKGVRWGKPWQRYVCNNCGHGWSCAPPAAPDGEDGLPVVPFYTMQCPHCWSTETVVTHSNSPERRHKCRKCGKTFKSREENPPKTTN